MGLLEKRPLALMAFISSCQPSNLKERNSRKKNALGFLKTGMRGLAFRGLNSRVNGNGKWNMPASSAEAGSIACFKAFVVIK
jgi:hypothetical protein